MIISRNWNFVFLLSLGVGLLPGCKPKDLSTQKPNIILIMADDLGYNELESYGQKIIKTPRLDQLAAEGMRFTDFYAGSPVCAPSRCVLLTGQHTGHAYVRDNYELGGYTDETEGGQLPLLPETQTIGKLLKERGYRTGIIGKWGLGGPGSTGVPNEQGFDYFYGYLCQKQAHNYYPSHLWENQHWDTLANEFFMAHQKLEGDPDDLNSYEKYKGKDYAPDKMRDRALQFIRDNKDSSFFLYLPFTVPHLSIQVPDDEPSLGFYKKIIPDTPYVGNKGYLPHQFPRAGYAAMITRMDRDIGKIIELLNELQLDDNTIIIFTSDNGPTYGGIGGSDTEYFESNKPFSGLKGSVYEGGIRVPMIVWWPGKTTAGSVSGHVSAFQDILPTLLEIVGGPEPQNLDGISFLPTLFNSEQPEHEYLYWEFPAYGGQQAIRMGKWKALRKNLKKDTKAPIELYDLEIDVAELHDMADQHPELIKEIENILQTARTPSDTFEFPALDISVDALMEGNQN